MQILNRLAAENLLARHLVLVILIIQDVVCSILFYVTVSPELSKLGLTWDMDGWISYATVFKSIFHGNKVDFAAFAISFPYFETILSPVFSFCLAALDLLINNMFISVIVLNSILSIATIFILQKTIKTLYGSQENEDMFIIIIYLTNVVICLDFILGSQTDPLVNFFVNLGFLTNARLFKRMNFKNGIVAFLTNTMIMFSKDTIWPFLIFTPALYFFSYILKYEQTPHISRSSFIFKLLNLFYVCTLLPALIYLGFLLTFNLVPNLIETYMLLVNFGAGRDFLTFILNAFLAFSFIPVLILLNLKPIVRKAENLPVLMWLGIFSIARIFGQGPFLAHFWISDIFCFCIICYQPITNYNSKLKQHVILWLLVVSNELLIFLFIIFPQLYIPTLY